MRTTFFYSSTLDSLCSSSSVLSDFFIVVMAAFLFPLCLCRSLDSRKIAVGGYLLLLKKLKVLTAVGFTDSEASQATTSSSQVCIHACACCSYMYVEQIYYCTYILCWFLDVEHICYYSETCLIKTTCIRGPPLYKDPLVMSQ